MRYLFHTNCFTKSCPQYLECIALLWNLGILVNPLLLDDFECSSHLFYVFMDLNTYCLGLPKSSKINFQNSQQPAIQEPTWQRKGIQYFPMKTQRRRWPPFLKKRTNFYCWKTPPNVQNYNLELLWTNQSFVMLDKNSCVWIWIFEHWYLWIQKAPIVGIFRESSSLPVNVDQLNEYTGEHRCSTIGATKIRLSTWDK